MDQHHPISQLDLLAYADDPLGLEPRRRAAIELHLSQNAEDAARVEAFRRQNAALRERYEPCARAPVPQRLYDALDHAPESAGRRLVRYAAAAAIIAVTAAAGWFAGDRYGGPAPVALDEKPLTGEEMASAGDGGTAPPATDPVSVAGILEYGSLPDLGHLGYSLVATEPVAGASPEAVSLSYAGGDGRTFTLLLRPRWYDLNPGFHVRKDGDTAVVSWEEGRFAAELTSEAGREEALEIAEAVRNALKPPGPGSPSPAGGRLAAGAAEPLGPIDAAAPVLPQQVR